MTDGELQAIVDKVMASLPAGVTVPHPQVIEGPRNIPAVQRKAGVQSFRHGAVVCLPMLDLVYIFRASLEREFGADRARMEQTIRRALVDVVAAGFRS